MAGVDSPVAKGRLGIHVLSDKRGESIVVTLPNGQWFVVDAHQGTPAGTDGIGATRTFIDQMGLSANDCLFVLLTHFHRDHYDGIPKLLKGLRKQNDKVSFATLGCYRISNARESIEDIIEWGETKVPQKKLQTQPGARARDVIALCRQDYRETPRWMPLVGQGHDLEPYDCEIMTIAPTGEILDSYLQGSELEKLSQNLPEEVDIENEKVREIRRRQRRMFNNLSVVLWIRYGDTRVLLTGDCENDGWNSLGGTPEAQFPLEGVGNVLERPTLMKMPHHASQHTWNETLKRCYEECSYAIATHWQGRTSLPALKALSRAIERNVVVAVPSSSLLPAGAGLSDKPSITRIQIPGRSTSNLEQAEALKDRTRENIRSHSGEIAWVSASLDRQGRSQWFGGSEAAFVRILDG